MAQVLDAIDRCLERGDLKRAEVYIARGLRTANPTAEERVEILLRRARARLLSEKPDDALEDVRTCCTLLPSLADRPAVMELMGDIYFARFELAPLGFVDRADADQALRHYDALLAGYPDYENRGWLWYQKGRVLLSEDRTEEAVAAFHEALAQPSDVPTLKALCYERLGFVELFEHRNPGAALSYFQQAAAAYPPNEATGWLVQLHILRSRALREQKRHIEALVVARHAFAIVDRTAPDYRRLITEAYLAVGEALAEIAGREEDAIEYLVMFLLLGKRPLGVDVTWSRVHETIGDLSFRLGRYAQAIEAYASALTFNPYHPLAMALHYRMARSYYRMGAYGDVIRTVEKMQQIAAADNEPIHDYRVFRVLGNACFALEQYDRAVEAYRHALSLGPGPEHQEQIETYLALAEERRLRRQTGDQPLQVHVLDG